MFSPSFKTILIILLSLLAGYSLFHLASDIQLQKSSLSKNKIITNKVLSPISNHPSPIRLIGTIVTQGKKLSWALIAESGTPEKVYRLGETLKSGARILDITADSIIVSHNGYLEHILLRPD